MGETSTDERRPARWANLRVLWSFVRPHRAVLSVGMVLALLVTGTSLASPLVTKNLLDGLDSGQVSVTAVVVLAVLMVVSSGLSYVQIVLLGRMGEKIVLGARTSMVRRLFRVRPVVLARRSSGEFVTRVTSDSVLLREATSLALVEFVNGTVGIVGALVLMAVLDWVLLATTVVTLVVVAAGVMALMPALAAAQRDSQDAIGRLGAAFEGAMRAVRTVKASRAEAREADRILVEAQTSAQHSFRAIRIQALAWTITGGGLSVALMLVLGLGAYRVSEGALAVSSLVAFLLYAFQLMAPAMILAQVVTQLQSGIAAAARISDVLAMPVEQEADDQAGLPDPSSDPSSGTDPAPAGPVVLSFREVTVRYAPGTPAALDDVSVDVARTGHTAIVGPSGAGKTTMFSLALRFLNPESGSLTLDGVPVEQWPLASLRRRMVYVEQDAPLVPGTLAENLRYTNPAATDDELWDALRAVQLDERVHQLDDGLATAMFGAAISGGERQRVALARALVSRPEILLLDEATAQLDALTEAAVHRAVRQLATTGAVVTIAHRLSTVVDADQIILMEAGRCRAVGTHTELLHADELYAKLVTALRIATESESEPESEADGPRANAPGLDDELSLAGSPV